MKQDMPKNPDTSENEPSEGEGTSRRQLLTGGAALLVGVATATLAGSSKAAAPGCTPGGNPADTKAKRSGILCKHVNLVPVTHYNNPALVSVVVKAWTDFGYYQALVEPGTTKRALEFMGVTIETGVTPVVLTQEIFENEGYQIGQTDDVILYVLPTPPVGGGTTGQAARDAMAAVPFGM